MEKEEEERKKNKRRDEIDEKEENMEQKRELIKEKMMEDGRVKEHMERHADMDTCTHVTRHAASV
jgi:hypothetical protein